MPAGCYLHAAYQGGFMLPVPVLRIIIDYYLNLLLRIIGHHARKRAYYVELLRFCCRVYPKILIGAQITQTIKEHTFTTPRRRILPAIT